ncbi:hypothetical protein SAMN05216247_11364 [Pseudomonas salomonii]|uniref:Uncharacterized protein n=1 Tax=Pseudomonas salomonii TaxID=191391 RepID=A0A1H3U6U2_9PSED|nr:hypothetical protein [Pseudomonas sp. 58 R 3]SDZ58130.1 hypothetical protein SAMN05216247_11364 [Pseudomonas salomonii]
MVHQIESMLLSDLVLELLDFRAGELDNLIGIQVNHVIVMTTVSQFEHCMTAVEIMTNHQPCGFKLGQHTVNRGQANVLVRLHQRLVNILGTHVALLSRIEHL